MERKMDTKKKTKFINMIFCVVFRFAYLLQFCFYEYVHVCILDGRKKNQTQCDIGP